MRPIGVPRELVAQRIARELRPGMVVNLGIGLPTLVAHHVQPGNGILFQAENGVLGYGPSPDDPSEYDPDLIDAGGQPISVNPGAAFFDSVASFAMIRGRHIDVAVLGALQVSALGDLANWIVPSRGGGSIGGAMDLALGARRLIACMEHCSPDGSPRILETCTYPLTAVGVVSLVVSDLSVLEVTHGGLLLRERAPGVGIEEIQAATQAHLIIPAEVPEMRFELPPSSRSPDEAPNVG